MRILYKDSMRLLYKDSMRLRMPSQRKAVVTIIRLELMVCGCASPTFAVVQLLQLMRQNTDERKDKDVRKQHRSWNTGCGYRHNGVWPSCSRRRRSCHCSPRSEPSADRTSCTKITRRENIIDRHNEMHYIHRASVVNWDTLSQRAKTKTFANMIDRGTRVADVVTTKCCRCRNAWCVAGDSTSAA